MQTQTPIPTEEMERARKWWQRLGIEGTATRAAAERLYSLVAPSAGLVLDGSARAGTKGDEWPQGI